MLLPSNLETWYQSNAGFIAGIDEAGRGPLAGPVVAACVVLEAQTSIPGLNDSKKLSEKKRLVLFGEIILHARGYGVGIVSSTQIDEINILRASLLAMKLSLDDLSAKANFAVTGALVDGNQRAPLSSSITQWPIVGGDAIWPVIMAASILAKVTRDQIMTQMADLYPGYGFAEHKGYGTKDHLTALKSLGPCPIHRRSFAPVRKEYDSHERGSIAAR